MKAGLLASDSISYEKLESRQAVLPTIFLSMVKAGDIL